MFKAFVANQRRGVVRFTVKISVGCCAYLAFDEYVGCLRRVVGPSMAPTLNKIYDTDPVTRDRRGNLNLFDEYVYFSRNTKNIERGDVVTFARPGKSNGVKRVIALAGDTITPQVPGAGVGKPVLLNEGEVWVESDAGFGYHDSSIFGPIKLDAIEGIGQFSFVPFEKRPRRLSRFIPESAQIRLIIPADTEETDLKSSESLKKED